MSDDLVVILNSRIAGTVTHEFGRPRFTYADTYLDGGGSKTPLSLSMPVRRGHLYSHQKTAPWLSGLLPDDPRVRDSWAAEYGVSAANPTALLRHIGRDCAGAVQIAPPHAVKEVLSQSGHLEPVTEAQVGARLRELIGDPDHWTQASERWSLAGAQSKFTAVKTQTGWAWGHGNTPSTHIIKPGITRFRAQALNEHLCQKAFAAVGIRTASTEYHEFDGTPAIIVTRYDRVTTPDGSVVRLHQEDMCQALSVWPHRKYASDGGPTAVAIAQLLGSVAAQSDVDRFADVQLAGYLAGAPDGHAKNYSVILAGQKAVLAPIYDVASSFPYNPDPKSSLSRVAMPIGGKSRFGDVDLHYIEKFARNAGTDPDRLVARTRELAEALPQTIIDAANDLPASTDAAALAGQIADGITRQRDTLDPRARGARARRAKELNDDPETWTPPTESVATEDVPVVAHTRGNKAIGSHTRRRPARTS